MCGYNSKSYFSGLSNLITALLKSTPFSLDQRQQIYKIGILLHDCWDFLNALPLSSAFNHLSSLLFFCTFRRREFIVITHAYNLHPAGKKSVCEIFKKTVHGLIRVYFLDSTSV
jgi:hypothetical protein